MLKTTLKTGLLTIILCSSFAYAQTSTCFDINPSLTKLGWINDSNNQISMAPDAYRHVEERKMTIYFKNGKKDDFQVGVFKIANECHIEDGLGSIKAYSKDIADIVDHIALNGLDEKMKLKNMVSESEVKKRKKSFFRRKSVNNSKESFEQIMFKTAEEKLCNQKKYLTQALQENEFQTKKRYAIKSFEVGIKEISCGQDVVFPEDIYCDLTYVKQLDIAPVK